MDARKLIENYKQLVALHGRMGQTILQLIAHPDATDEHLKEICVKYRELTKSIQDSKPKIVEALYKKGATLEANQIQGVTLWQQRK